MLEVALQQAADRERDLEEKLANRAERVRFDNVHRIPCPSLAPNPPNLKRKKRDGIAFLNVCMCPLHKPI